MYKVTAIISTFKAERFMRACLEDLARQTIFAQTEIIVVDACSPEKEEKIVREFMDSYPNIAYVRADTRETLYASWNRAIQMAHGQYLTNANADDRHHPECFERLARVLDKHPEVGIAYADARVTDKENSIFETAPITRYLHWRPYDHLNLLRRCEIGPQPMWRAALHKELGMFNDTLAVVGDLDFWLRVSERYPLRHIPEELGLYLHHEGNLERRSLQRTYNEELTIKERYIKRFLQTDFLWREPLPPLLAAHAHAVTIYLQNAQSTGCIGNLNDFDHHFFAYALLAAKMGDIENALDVLNIHFTLINNSKNLCHLYRILLLTSPGAPAGELRPVALPSSDEVQPLSVPFKDKGDFTCISQRCLPQVSVVIPLYNQGQFLEDAVRSVRAQTDPQWEMLIINDGSTDRSLTQAKQLLAKLQDPRIRLVSQANAGKGATRNRGVRETSAPFVCILDADDMIVPTYFATARHMLESNADLGWICPKTLVFGGNNHVIWEKEYSFLSSLLQCPCPVTALYRRTIWEELGGYLETMTDREDWEFWVRAGEAGWRGGTSEKVLFIYRHAFQRFGQKPRINVLSKLEYIALHPWWFRKTSKEELARMLNAFSIGKLPQEILNMSSVNAVTPYLNDKQAFCEAVKNLQKNY